MPPEIVNQPLINGEEYTFAQAKILVAGVPLFGVTSIEYTEEQTKENNYGAGVRPVSRGRAEITPTVSIEIMQTDVERLRELAPAGSLTRLEPFKIVVTFNNGQVIRVHQINNCEFEDDGLSSSQGDTSNTQSFSLIASDILWRP